MARKLQEATNGLCTVTNYRVRLVEGVDLKYFLSVGDEINCQLKMLDTKVGGDQFVVKMGWLSKLTESCSVRSPLQPESAGLH